MRPKQRENIAGDESAAAQGFGRVTAKQSPQFDPKGWLMMLNMTSQLLRGSLISLWLTSSILLVFGQA